ncbi:hypothetical protein AK812_SmicGene23039 [Symbiodinium microadriaticum]|uniref:Integrase catalytic domain-containing protein n=1 Tax=Symbiodinium microadriaticum TaxID=2951 RepID=A0A1Q9DI97_SYMMI|nr:hypothetical protein AK812_SmicGene23039 [Symbiodinium microadriaticum]
MDATAPINPAGVTIPEETGVSDITGDNDTESARSRSVPGTELQVNTAREGQVALTEAALRSHTVYTPTSVASYRPSAHPVPGLVAPTHTLVSAPTIVPTLISNTYNQQNNTILSNDNGLLVEAANARHEEIVGQIRNENREQMLNLEMTANSHVAQLRLEHARLENRTREMEEMASQNALLGQQAVARHQSEANAAAEQAQILQQRLRSAESSADAVVAQVEAEARRREMERHHDSLAKNDEISRMKSEMQEMMRVQQEGIQLLKFDNENLRRRLAEAEARNKPTVERPFDPSGVEGPPGLFATHIGTPPEQPIPEPEGTRPEKAEERAEGDNDEKEKKSKKHKKKKHKRDDSSDSSSSVDQKALLKFLKKVVKNKKDKDDDDDDKETSKNKPKVKEAEKVVFPKFPKPEQYRNWRIRVREAIVAASDSPDKAHAWIAKVWEKDADEKALRDSEGFSTLDAKIMSALTNILEGDFGRQVDTFKETEAHSGRMVRGRQLLLRLHNYFATNALHGSVYDMEDLMNCKMVNDNLNAFLRNWDTILSGRSRTPGGGSAQDLIAERELGQATPFESASPISMMTANGPNSANQQCDVSVDSIGVKVAPYVLPETPSVLSIGQRCMDEGFDFVWRANSRPYLRSSEGKKVFMDVKDNVPYLKAWPENVSAKDGTKLPGKLHVTKHRVLTFNPKTYHAVRPWKGDRWSITSYVNRAVHKLDSEQLAQLKEYGFHVPSKVSAPSSLLVSPDDKEKTLFDLVSDGIDKELAADLASKPKAKSKGIKGKEKKTKPEPPSSTKPAPPTEEEIAEALELVEEYGTDAEDEAADDPGSSRPPEGEAVAPDGESAVKVVKHSKGVEALKEEAKSRHHLMTHQPKNPYCDICQRAKMYKPPSYATGGFNTVEAKEFGDHVTADHIVIYRDKDVALEDSRLALVIKDVATHFTYAYPSALKSTEECVSALQHFTSAKDTIKVFYSDRAEERKKAAKIMNWRHERSKAYIHESNAIAERQVRSVTEGTRTNLLQAGVSHVYWPYALEHTCTAFNISHVNGDEYTPWFKRFGVKFPGDLIPFGCRIDYWVGPKAKRKDRDRFAPTSEPGVFLGYRFQPGMKWRKEILVLPIKDLNRNDFHECLSPISAYQFKLPEGNFTFPMKERFERIAAGFSTEAIEGPVSQSLENQDAEEQDQQPEGTAIEPGADAKAEAPEVIDPRWPKEWLGKYKENGSGSQRRTRPADAEA